MLFLDWANGPSAATATATANEELSANNHDENWNPPERSGRSASPTRTGNMERSRSPIGDRVEATNGSQATDRGRSSDVANPGNNLHVSGISLKADDHDLESLFSKYGRVIKSQLMRDPHTREVRGFGFVTMETSEQAALAMSSLDGTEFLGKPLSVEKARRSRGRTPTPGHYRGPPKRDEGHRPYQPSRGGGGGGYYYRYDPYERRYDDRMRRDFDDHRYVSGGGGSTRRGGGDYDDRRYRYDDRSNSHDRFGYAAPMRDRYDDRYDRRRDDRDYDRRRY